ncbi:MAG: exodeoxyribonuclease VII small subunit [Sphingobacteriales bacterium]|jgi:exodeoxyribonuclease VII small subunit
MEENMTYKAAFEELNDICKAIELESFSVDELAAKVKRAADLLKFCESRLRNTEEEVNNIIGGITE